MSKSSGANDSSTKALRKLEAQGLAFTNDAFLSEIIGGDLEKVALFIEAGIDVNVAVNGMRPILLLASSRRGNCEIARLLIDNGVDVNAVNEDGVTAICMAVFNNHKELVKLLVTGGVDVNRRDKGGTLPLHSAIDKQHFEIAEFLIQNGANVNAIAWGSTTALSLAVHAENLELVKLLVANGGDVNLKSENCTPLDLASRNGHTEIAEFLIAHGAKLSAISAPQERTEITHLIERLELLEEKFNIAISGLYATCIYQSHGTLPCHEVMINFDVTSLGGGKLESDLRIHASAYNSAGQLLKTETTYLIYDKFMGFESMSITSHLDQVPARIRLSPAAY